MALVNENELDLSSSDETSFLNDQVEPIIMQSIDAVLANEMYDEIKVQHWVDAICEHCMKGLTELNKPFKYVVSCLIVQKNGAGIHATHSCYWDMTNDNVAIVKWPTDKQRDQNNRMYCVVTVFGCSLLQLGLQGR